LTIQWCREGGHQNGDLLTWDAGPLGEHAWEILLHRSRAEGRKPSGVSSSVLERHVSA
jgi:hypothetical protein